MMIGLINAVLQNSDFVFLSNRFNSLNHQIQ
jgi:hypothetical protein